MSRVEWVNPETGEVLPEEQDGAVPCPVYPPELVEDAQAFGDWYLRELVSLEARETALKAQHKRALRRLGTERDSLARSLPVLESATRSLLVGKSQSVDFAYGRASFRRTTRTEVDAEEALAWALTNDQGAVKWGEPSLLKSKLSDDCPHKRTVREESFSVKGAK